MTVEWELYAKIRKLKTDGVTMRRVADNLGISRNTVKRYWNGLHTPDDKSRHEVA